MGWMEWVLVVLLIIGGVICFLAWMSYQQDKEKARREERQEAAGDARDHELALADREMTMWREATVKPTEGVFSRPRLSPPKLVGRSQVLEGQPRPTKLDMLERPPDDPSPTIPFERVGGDLAVRQCSLLGVQHPGHTWEEPRQGDGRDVPPSISRYWCDGMNADCSVPYDPGRAGWVDTGPGVRKGVGANEGIEEREQP
jgi:hypothetical protein